MSILCQIKLFNKTNKNKISLTLNFRMVEYGCKIYNFMCKSKSYKLSLINASEVRDFS